MANVVRSSAALLGLLTLACGTTPDGAGTESSTGPSLAVAAGVEESVSGGGQFFHPVFGTVTLAFTAVRHADGSVTGRFQQQQFDVGFSYKGTVTCFAIDPVNRRAWIGGVLTQTTDPDPITEVGDDAWFRVLDVANGAGPDRSTFLGFEGGGGIITSGEYCSARIWPDDNARTWPLENGELAIR